jgi:NAD(P)H-hydrate epimerase
LVIDADALNILSENPNWYQKIARHSILTPHPGEMARLTGKTIKEIEFDRVNICRSYAIKWGCIVILKGAFTVIGSPNGSTWISLLANPNLATAGTGDILAGIVSGLLAQKVESLDAAISGVYLHGLSAEMANPEYVSSGIIASDLLPHIPRAMSQITKREFRNG